MTRKTKGKVKYKNQFKEVQDDGVRWDSKQSQMQCDQIWRFLKVFCNKCYFKIGPNIWQLFGQFWSISLFKKKHYFYYILGIYWKILFTLIPTSGHTDGNEWDGAKKTKRIKITQMKQSSSVRIPALHTT